MSTNRDKFGADSSLATNRDVYQLGYLRIDLLPTAESTAYTARSTVCTARSVRAQPDQRRTQPDQQRTQPDQWRAQVDHLAGLQLEVWRFVARQLNIWLI